MPPASALCRSSVRIHRIQAVDRLVEDQHLRVAQQRRRQPQALPHSQGEGAHPPPGRITQPDDIEHLGHPMPTDPCARGHPTQVTAAVREGCAPEPSSTAPTVRSGSRSSR